MDQEPLIIRQITAADEFEALVPSLVALLQLCVNPDPRCSSIGFLAPLSDSDATDYWLTVLPKLNGPQPLAYMLVATTKSNPKDVVGTVQLSHIPKITHFHRGEVQKLLVHPSMRGLGLGKKLMHDLEELSRGLGKTFLVLDTAAETDARAFYQKTGWTQWGLCPDYALFADGRMALCAFFYKYLTATT
jgi:GNAT superfamily N-acetyltransferase